MKNYKYLIFTVFLRAGFGQTIEAKDRIEAFEKLDEYIKKVYGGYSIATIQLKDEEPKEFKKLEDSFA